jgi:hypothetical protein
MNFREVLDRLCANLGHNEVAKALGISVQAIRQARMRPESSGFRAPPKDWENVAIRLAEERVWQYRKLIEQIRGDRQGGK